MVQTIVDQGTFGISILGAGKFTSAGPVLDRDSYVLEYISGFRVGVTVGEEQLLSNAEKFVGEWAAVYRSITGPESYAIRTDPFGYFTLFYRLVSNSSGGTDVFVSSSAAGLTYMLAEESYDVDIYWPEFVGSVGTEQHWAKTMQSHRTFGSDVYILLPGETLYIGKDRVSLVGTSLFEGDTDSYTRLLDRGIEKAISSLQLAVSLPVEKRDIKLSGGRDSRMVVALLTAAGLERHFTVSTVNPKIWPNESARPGLWQDLRIANALRNRYGLDWSADGDLGYIPQSFQQSLSSWQEYRSNQYYYFAPSHGYYFEKEGLAELRGAAGETFRGFKSAESLVRVLELGDRSDTLEADLEKVIRYIFRNDYLDQDLHANILSDAFDVLDMLGGETALEVLNRRYSIFRNRSHFGHIRSSISHGAFPFFPLSQQEFVLAGQKLSPELKNSNQIAFDIIERLNPELNDLRFDNGEWASAIKKRSRKISTPTRVWDSDLETAGLDEFFRRSESDLAARSVLSNALGQAGSENLGHGSRIDIENRLRTYFGNLLSLPSARSALNIRFINNLLSGVSRGTRNGGAMLAKLASAQDMLVATRPDKLIRKSLGSNAADSQFSGNMLRRSVLPTMTQRLRSFRFGHPKLDLKVQSTADGIHPVLTVGGTVEGELEYAFYLIVGGSTVEKRWYDDRNSCSFASKHIAGDISVKGFARFKDVPELVFSEEISI